MIPPAAAELLKLDLLLIVATTLSFIVDVLIHATRRRR